MASSGSVWRKLNITHWDIHFYFDHTKETSIASANEIRLASKSTFPSVRVYDMVPKPIGPHPVDMFEAHILNEQQFGEVVAWLAFNRKEHSVLVHPNAAGNGGKGAEDDHTIHSVRLGTPLKLDLKIFRRK